MKFIETIKNIWKVEDLRNRLLTTLLFVLIYRFGSFVVLPGINPQALSALHSQTARSDGALGYVLWWCLLECFGIRVGYHALHLRIDRSTAADYCSAVLPEDAEGG